MLLGLVTLLLAASVWASVIGKPGQVVRERATTVSATGEVVEYEIGTLFVPENRASAQSRLIGVGYARLFSTHKAKTPPLFVLPGGPGDTVLGALADDDERSLRRRKMFLDYREAGDVVILDQRGYSPRGEMLTLPVRAVAQPLDRPATIEARVEAEVARARAAVAAHADKDLAGYTILECVEDLNDLRRALGYDQVTLVGQSFGSQWSFAVMRTHPQIVARALLSGVEPLAATYDMPSHVYAALQRMAWEANQEPFLIPYLPPGGLMGAVAALRQRFARAPITVAVEVEGTNERRNVVLGSGDLQRALLTPTEAWPARILSLYHGHYDAWAKEVIAERGADSSVEAMIGPLIDSSIGVSAAREQQLRTDPAVALLGEWDFAGYIAAASVWPSADVGDDFRAPSQSDIPVLFVHGDWDTSTPIENTLGMLPYFSKRHAIVVHRGGHGAYAALLQQLPKVKTQVLSFLRSGQLAQLPVNVELSTPKFQRPDFPAPAFR
jgi:pimeloyl-ACP methyl ester carboxylesterase